MYKGMHRFLPSLVKMDGYATPQELIVELTRFFFYGIMPGEK